jgi:hypothetical protein
MTSGTHRLIGFVAVLITMGVLTWGFLIVGSPETRRLERMDERRVEDLQHITREIQRMVYDAEAPGVLKRALPKDLEEVERKAKFWKISLVDPETGEAYGYAVKTDTTYELCATFALPRDKSTEVFWNHPAGPHCFVIDALDAP